eukprot:85406-Amphidinium_carterae.1
MAIADSMMYMTELHETKEVILRSSRLWNVADKTKHDGYVKQIDEWNYYHIKNEVVGAKDEQPVLPVIRRLRVCLLGGEGLPSG